MTFAAPLALVALAGLPLLWWLLRVTPPSPRQETFPAIRLLLGLNPAEETPARTPWWLLLLRLTAAALVILALARPLLDSTGSMAGYWTGPAGDRQRLGRRARVAPPDADGEYRAGPGLIGPAGVSRCSPRPPMKPEPRRKRPRPCRWATSARNWVRCVPEAWPSTRAAAVPADWTPPRRHRRLHRRRTDGRFELRGIRAAAVRHRQGDRDLLRYRNSKTAAATGDRGRSHGRSPPLGHWCRACWREMPPGEAPETDHRAGPRR